MDKADIWGRFGKRLRNLRHSRRLTQTEVVRGVEQLGAEITQGWLVRMELHNATPNYAVLEAIARVLGVTPDYFLPYVDEATAEAISSVSLILQRCEPETRKDILAYALTRQATNGAEGRLTALIETFGDATLRRRAAEVS